MSLEYEPASEPLYISVKQLYLHLKYVRQKGVVVVSS
jgi:hypothetical protein